MTDGHAISRILCIFISVLYVARSWCMRSQPRASQGVVGIPWLWGWVTLWPSESPHIFPPPPPLAIPPSPTLLLLLLFSPRPLPNPAFFHVLAQTRRFITCTGNWRGIIVSSVHCKFICSVIYRKYIPFFPPLKRTLMPPVPSSRAKVRRHTEPGVVTHSALNSHSPPSPYSPFSSTSPSPPLQGPFPQRPYYDSSVTNICDIFNVPERSDNALILRTHHAQLTCTE